MTEARYNSVEGHGTATATNPKKPGHSIANPPYRTSVIEVPVKGPQAIEPQLHRRGHIERHIKRHITHPQSREESATSSHDILDSIRIRSTYLLDLLIDATGVRSDHGGTKSPVYECTSHAFLYPFSIPMTYSEEIKKFAEQSQESVSLATQDMRPPTNPESNGNPDTISSDGATITTNMQSGSLRKDDDYTLESKEAFQDQQLVIAAAFFARSFCFT